MLLCRHGVGTYQEMSSYATCQGTLSQSSQLAEPVWTDPGIKNGTSVCNLIFTSKKSVDGEWIVELLPKSSHTRKKPPPKSTTIYIHVKLVIPLLLFLSSSVPGWASMTGGSLVHGYQVGHKYATRSKGSKAYQKFLIGASHTTLASVFLWVFVLSLHSMYPGKHPSMVHFMRKKRRVLSSAGFHCIQESQTLPNTQTSLLFILWQCPMVHF